MALVTNTTMTYGEFLSWVDGFLFNQIGTDISSYQLEKIKTKLNQVRTNDTTSPVGYSTGEVNLQNAVAQGRGY